VAVDRPRLGADHSTRGRAPAIAELVCDPWRSLGRDDAWSRLAYVFKRPRLGRLDRSRPWGRARRYFSYAITSLVASFFVDDVADLVEREHYPAEHPGVALPIGLAIGEGVRTALLTILVYLIALPFVIAAGAGFLIFFIATAWLLGKQYFELAAMRFRSPEEARLMRKDNAATIFTAGLIIAAFVSIPIVNLATPLFGMAFMVHMHKMLSGSRPELIEPTRRTGVPTT
jgi:Sulfate transporter CysZ/Etoposide-induced protein 2.4